MKTTGFVLICLLPLMAVAEPPKEPAPDKKATHDELIAMREGILQAIKNKDVEALIGYLHPDVVLTLQDGKDLKVIRKHDGAREYFVRLLTGPQAPVKVFAPAPTVDESTILYGDNMGIAFGTSRDHYVLADNTEFDVPTRWSATMVRHDGKWKVANLQVSSNPFDNPVVASLSKMIYWAGCGGTALGILIGMALMMLFRKSSKPAASAGA